MPENKHTQDQLDAFADEIISIMKAQRALLIDKIEKFHTTNCTTSEKNKEACATAFTFNFLEYVENRILKEFPNLNGELN